MTEVDDVNLCLSTFPTDTVQQMNCIRTALGYNTVVATSESPSSSGNLLLLAGVATAIYFLAIKKK